MKQRNCSAIKAAAKATLVLSVAVLKELTRSIEGRSALLFERQF